MPNTPPQQWRAGLGYLPPINPNQQASASPSPNMAFPYPFPFFGGHYPFVPPQLHAQAPGFSPGWHAYGAPPPTHPAPEAVTDTSKRVTGSTIADGLRTGVNYVYPPHHTQIHVIDAAKSSLGSDKLWDKPCLNPFFSMHKVGVDMPLRVFMEQIGAKGDEWVITEVFELGDGVWGKGTTVWYKDERSREALEKFGWGKERGTGMAPPVWVVLEKK